jgi:uncharacterized protein YuzE
MRWTFDSNADVFHLYLDDQASDRQIDLGGGQILDVNADGQVIGVEILDRRGQGDIALLEGNGMPVSALRVLALITASRLPLVAPEGDLRDFVQVAEAVSRQQKDALELAFAQAG